MALTFAQVHDLLTQRVEVVDGFVAAQQPLDPRAMPAQIADRSFALALSTRNARLDRDKKTGYMMADHVVTVDFLRQIALKSQVNTYRSALEDEDQIVQSLLSQTGEWQEEMRILYEGTERELIADGAWLRVRMTFQCRHLVELT